MVHAFKVLSSAWWERGEEGITGVKRVLDQMADDIYTLGTWNSRPSSAPLMQTGVCTPCHFLKVMTNPFILHEVEVVVMTQCSHSPFVKSPYSGVTCKLVDGFRSRTWLHSCVYKGSILRGWGYHLAGHWFWWLCKSCLSILWYLTQW